MAVIFEILSLVLMIPAMGFAIKFAIDVAKGKHKNNPRILEKLGLTILLLFVLPLLGQWFAP